MGYQIRGSGQPQGAVKRKRAPGLAARRPLQNEPVERIDQAVSTVEGSTLTPGPIVEVTAMRWM